MTKIYATCIIAAVAWCAAAQACSPRLDGEPTRCPNPEDFILPDPKPKPMPQPTPPKGEIDIWSNAGLWQLHHMYQKYERRKHLEANMTPPSDSINKALMEFNYGSNDTTQSEELLQLPSNED